MSVFLWMARLLTPDYFKVAKSTNTIQVITIAFSHYCELACWALRAGGKDYEERGYAAGQHVLPALRARVCHGKYLSQSSRVTSLKECGMLEKGEAQLSDKEKQYLQKRDRSARATAVPIAICPDGKVLRDSWEIAEHSGLAPVPSDLRQLFDNELGPLARQAAYAFVLKRENIAGFYEICTKGRIWIWRWCFHLFIASSLLQTMTKLFRPDDPEAVRACLVKLDAVFEKLDVLVKNRKGRFLTGDTLTLTDLALASLAAPMVLPPLYCEGKFNETFMKVYNQDAEMRKEVEKYRSTVTGQYVLELYASHRLK